MDMVDMMRDEPDETSGPGCMPCSPASKQQYPYGLNIRLEADELKKLGISDLPAVGTRIDGQFQGIVTSANVELNYEGGACVSIQITQLAMDVAAQQAVKIAAEAQNPAAQVRSGKPIIVE